MRKKLIVLLMLVMTLFVTGCGDDIAFSKDGTAARYSLSDIYSGELFGFYMLDEEGDFRPLMSNYTGSAVEDTPQASQKYIWWADYKYKSDYLEFDKMVPGLNKDSKVVIIYDSGKDIPEDLVLEKYENLGATVGANFFIGEDNDSLYVSDSDVIETSQIGKALKYYETDRTEVLKINGSSDLPIKNVDRDMNVLLGLEKDKFYEFTIYLGTSNTTVTVPADTTILKCTNSIRLTDSVKKTEDQYFELQLPENLAPGYYRINNSGLFKVLSPDA